MISPRSSQIMQMPTSEATATVKKAGRRCRKKARSPATTTQLVLAFELVISATKVFSAGEVNFSAALASARPRGPRRQR